MDRDREDEESILMICNQLVRNSGENRTEREARINLLTVSENACFNGI